MEHVVLVNEHDEPMGLMEKMEAHQKGLLHRAFSVFVFNTKGELLLQKRAASKYHSPNLWTNTCCSHPREKETTLEAANRRLMEEMGMTCHLKHAFHFIYQVSLDQGMIEHELDHVFIGTTDNLPVINPSEVGAYDYFPISDLSKQVIDQPEKFTEWFKICFDEVLKHYKP
ncbi:MAG: isopentenyl-diphosphate Delta-isomerase [Putridiphycobacter sp.]|nr:isopentenyl-diphosphate Delta-isomerase [Putridiphycobacter sp.]